MPSAHEILVALKAQYAGRGDIQQLTSDLQSIKKIDSFKGLQENFMRLNGEFVAAKERMRQLRAEMNQPGNGAMVAEYEAAKNSVDKLFTQITKSKASLDSQREALRQSGIEVTNLAGEYGRLKQSVDKISFTKAAEQTLGLKSIRDVKAEIAGAVQAYRTLSDSGKLSAAEQARALEALRKKTKELYATISTAPKLDAARAALGLDSGRSIDLQINKLKRAYAELAASGKLSMNELAQAKVALGRRIDELRGKTNSWRDSLLQAKGSLVEAAAAGAALFGAAKAGIAFETSMADVKKVVDGTPAQIKQLADELQGMTRTIPMTAEELAKIGAAGGQLGIAAKDISPFVEVTAKMATTFNMTAAEAGEAIGKLKNVFGLSIAEVGNFGDAINKLGNNAATNEKSIVDVMLRIGGTSKQFGLAKEQSAALAAAMLSLGKTPEVASTSINALLNNMQTATMGSKDFKEALEKIGMSAEGMASSVAKDPQKALLDLLATLEKLDGQKRAEVLTGLFGKEFQDDIGVLVGSLKTYRDTLQQVADKNSYAGSMQKEFSARAATTGNQLILLKNAVVEIATNIGTALLPVVKGGAEILTSMLTPIADLTKAFPKLSATIVALGTGAVIFKTITKVVDIAKMAMGTFSSGSVGSISKVSTAIKGLGVAFKWAGGLIGAALAGWSFGSWLNQFEPVQKGMTSIIHTIDLLQLAARRMWAALTGGDVTAIDEKIRIAKEAYSSRLQEIEKEAAENRKTDEGKKAQEVTAPKDDSASRPSTYEELVDHIKKGEAEKAKAEGAEPKPDEKKPISREQEAIDSRPASMLTDEQLKERKERLGTELSTDEIADEAKKEEQDKKAQVEKEEDEAKVSATKERNEKIAEAERAAEAEARAEKEDRTRRKQRLANIRGRDDFERDGLSLDDDTRDRGRRRWNRSRRRDDREVASGSGGGIDVSASMTDEEWASLTKEQKDTLAKKAAAPRKSYDYFNAGKQEQRFRGDTDIQPELARQAKSMLELNRIQAEQAKIIEEKVVTAEERKTKKAEEGLAKSKRQAELSEIDKKKDEERAAAAKKAEEEAAAANRARTELAKKTAEERAQAEISATEKAKSVFQRYADRVRQLQDEIAGREKSLAEELDDLDTTTPAEIKWKRQAKAAKDYEAAARKAMAAGNLGQALTLSDQAKSLFSGLKDGPSGISESLAKMTASRGLKSSGLLGIDIAKMLQGTAAKSALNAIPEKLFGNMTANIRSQLASVAEGGSSPASSGRGQVAKVHELRFKGGSLQGSQSDIEALLEQLAKAGLSAS